MTTKSCESAGKQAPESAAPASAAQRTAALLSDHEGGLPIWVRAPTRGLQHHCGLTRAKMYQLMSLGLVETRSLRQPGQIRGTRLFRLASLLAYIDGCEQGGVE